jgi:ABC-2 type transport system permease protein
MNVVLAFLEIAVQSLKNRIVARVRRMREPRYALGAVFGIAYFGWILFRNRGVSRLAGAFPATDVAANFAALGILLVMILAWAMPQDSGGLEFSEAEIAFLFPAPLRRRDLLLYKIVRQQPQVLVSVLVFTLLGKARLNFLGLWIGFSVLSIYMMMVALGRARLRLLGINFVVRLVGVLALLAALAYPIFRIAVAAIPPRGIPKPAAALQLARGVFAHPFLRRLLFVPRIFATAILPSTLFALFLGLGGLLVLAVVLFYAADRLNVSFEEASIAVSQRRERRLARMRERRGGGFIVFRRARAPFRLAEQGRPEIAIVWKNTVATMRMSLAWVIILAIVFGVMVANAFLGGKHAQEGVGFMFLMFTCILPFIGPNLFANDLRLDLPRLEVLKSYPLSGDSIVAAEIAAPLVLIAALEMVSIAFAALFMEWSGSMNFVDGAQFATVALLLAVPVVALQLLIRNAVPVLFPAWAGRSKEDPRGFVMTGQRLLLVIGNFIVLTIALIPAGIVFLPSFWIAIRFFQGSPISLALMTVPAVAVIVGEIWLGVKFLGARFEELDVSEEFDTVAI